MSVLDRLKGKVTFEKVERRRGSSQVNQVKKRRDKFVAYLNAQTKAVKAHPAKKEKKGARIDFFEQDGKFYFEPRFGSRKVIMDSTNPDAKIATTSRDELEVAISILIEATTAGELDDALAKAAERAPRKPKAQGNQDQGESDQPQDKTTTKAKR